MKLADIKLIITIIAMLLLYPYQAKAQWYNTIDQQQQNAIMKNQQDDALRQQRWNDLNNRLMQEQYKETLRQQQELNRRSMEMHNPTWEYHKGRGY